MRWILLLLVLVAPTSVALAQRGGPPDGEQRGGDDRRGGRDDDDDDEGDRDRRREEWRRRETEQRANMMRSFDRNGDGRIAPDEVPEEMRGRIGERLTQMGLDPNRPFAVNDYLNERQRMESSGGEYKPPFRPNPDMAFGSAEPAAKAVGFDQPLTPEERATTAMTVSTSSPTASRRDDAESRQVRAADDRIKGWARSQMESLDRDKNGALERDELDGLRGGGERYDTNKDGKVIYDEIVLTVSGFRRDSGSSNDSSESRGRDDGRRDEDRRDRSRDEGNSDDKQDDDDRKSYRFTPAIERLPDGLPSWFVDKDDNEDGQVAMHEYDSNWTDSKVERFREYDLNGDGILTPDEVAGQR